MVIPTLTKIDQLFHALATPLTIVLLNLEIALRSNHLPKSEDKNIRDALNAALKIKTLLNSYKR